MSTRTAAASATGSTNSSASPAGAKANRGVSASNEAAPEQSPVTAPAADPECKQDDPACTQAGAAGRTSRGTPDFSHLTNGQLLRWMFRFLAPVKPLALIACFYLAAWVGTEVLAVRQSGFAVNQIQEMHRNASATNSGIRAWIGGSDREAAHLRNLCFGLAALVAIHLVFRYLRIVAEMKLSMKMVFHIRAGVYDKLQRVGFGFHDAVSSGQLINRALTDLQNVRAFIQTALLMTLEIVLIVGGYIILVWTRSPWLALLSLVPLPIWTWYILRFSKKVQPAGKAVQEAGDKDVQIIAENIAGVHVVKAFATEKQEVGKYNTNIDDYLKKVVIRIKMYADFTPIMRSIATLSHLSLFFAVGVLIIKGKLDAGDFIILGSAMGAILGRLQQVAAINEQYQNAIVSARRLYEVLMAPPTVPEKPDAKPLPAGAGGVKFEHVTFGYDPAKPVLHDVSFEARPGTVVAIVGPTGAGKTTLINLLARFYDPQAGRITIDGMDVRDTSLSSLRTQVAFVFQETYLFSDTVAGNISYGRPNITRGEIEASARLSQAHEFIEGLPKQYESMLGERGSSLSGGQRQRLAIARAIVSNPRILVLDDATAAIDPETEDLIRRAMRFVMYGRTTFIIAHRISTVKRADLVVVLEEGKVTQVGTHEQLMNEKGHYREIAVVQLYGDDREEGQAAAGAEKKENPSHMDRVSDPREVAAAAAAAREQQGVPREEELPA